MTAAVAVADAEAVDLRRLVVDLLNRVDGEVRFDAASRAVYSTDASNYRQIPLGVVLPRTTEALAAAVRTCHEHGAPVLARGAGTSLAGQACNVAVVIDCSKYLRRIIELDPERRIARVEPGVPLDELRHAAEKHHLTFGPDPATHEYCTLGGMIGNNSCGIHSVMAGRTVDNVESLEVMTYDGTRLRVGPTSDVEFEQTIARGDRRAQIYRDLRALRDRYADDIRQRFPHVPRRVSGYALDELLPEKGFNLARALVGSESTCVTVLEATLRLVESPPFRSLLVIGYPDIYRAADDVPRMRSTGAIGVEGLDDRLRDDARAKGLHPDNFELLPDAGGWLLVEYGGRDAQEAHEAAAAVKAEVEGEPGVSVRHYDDPRQHHAVFEIRESGLGATAKVPGERDTWPGWEDSAVPPEDLGAYLRDLRGLLDRYGYEADFYGHFGDGCLHTRIPFDLRSADGVASYRRFIEEAADLVVDYGGSLSGEHGDGQARAELLPRMYGDSLVNAFEAFKAAWDPAGKMNPGKVVRANRLDADLHLGAEWRPPSVETRLSFDEQGGFAEVADRCVGVGKCRRTEEGTMCPSYQVTREEMHSTRGRARALFEMMKGDVITDGWKSEEVMDALHLCLSCKACLSECPVEVDMASYKAEFLSHYYEGRLRPRSAYAFGLIMYWARLAEVAPWLANLGTQTPGLRWLAKRVAGIAPERRLPAFARGTFRHWFRRRRTRGRISAERRVLLWPDTFNDHFHPQTARAAVEVLEAAGCEVIIPERRLCCGRPLYEYGWLDRAKRFLEEIVDALRDELRAGTPVVVLEPSCASVFREELLRQVPDDEDARRLSEQTLLLTEYLERIDYQPSPFARHAVVHGHCHQEAVMGMEADASVLSRAGLSAEVLDSGCCGMAGSFGFEAGDRYEVAVAAGERVLLPAVREAPPDSLVVSAGYSCREQIAQSTDRRALHPAEVLRLGLDSEGHRGEPPERRFPDEPATLRDAAWPALALGLVVTAFALVLRRRT